MTTNTTNTTNTPTPAPDLDARVAALMPCPFCGHETPEFERMGTSGHSCIVRCGNCGCSHESGDEYLQSGRSWNIRAELQKPEMHEPVSDQETIDAIRACHLKVTTELMIDMRRTLESFLQGRTKPTMVTPYISQEQFDRVFPDTKEPAQEEITDAHRALIEAADAVLKNEEHAVSCGARSYQKGSPTWEVYKELDACIRASKGEKT